MVKRDVLEKVGNIIIILLSIFILVFFIINEFFDLGLVILPIIFTLIFTSGIYFLEKKFKVSNYIMLPVIIIDGFFHLTSPLENLVENSPDWVIAFNLYGGNGMPVLVHQIMGVFLLGTSIGFIYYLFKKNENWFYYFYKYLVAIVTIVIISFSFVIKLVN